MPDLPTYAARPGVSVRKAVAADAGVMLELIEGLAKYEKLTPPDDAARERLVRDAFGPKPRFDVFLGEVDGRPAGYAFVFETYSTFLALPTLYLEDIFVLPEYRDRGAGIALFRHCVAEATRRGCGRLEFVVLDWNKLARDFYARLGAEHLTDWCYYRLRRDQFAGILNPSKESQ
jgi:GNAT superfamily N-acetyltransferase